MEVLLEKSIYKRPNPEKDKIWRLKNRERLKQKSLDWKRSNTERLILYRIENKDKAYERTTKWRKANREKSNQNTIKCTKKRLKNNPFYRLSYNIRTMITKSFKRGTNQFTKRAQAESILGCNIEAFITYIVSKCPEGTTFSDFGQYGYHIDHIVPISIAKTEEDVIRLNHYTNFQPLWWRDNIIKSNKFDKI